MAENYQDVLDSRMEFVKRRKWAQPLEGLEYYQQRTTNRAYEKHSYVSSGAIVPRARTVDGIPLMHVTPGFDNTYTPVEYKLGIRIDKRLRETDQFNVIDQHMEDLNQSARDTIELYAALPFNNGFGATSEWVCADGMYLFDSRDRELGSAGTWSNVETSSALSQASIATMRLDFRKNKNENGLLRPMTMDTVVIPPDLEDSAIVQLEGVLKPGSSLNDPNYLSRYGLKYKVWNYLTSATAWFGMAAKDSLYELFWYWGVKPEIKSYDVGNNPDIDAYRIRMVFVTGADRPMAIRGNAGA
jgi:hypothetical protein